jgi:NAD(P)-dependent dehydrogenase (short-subunit alcohol dehydrogenase family)
MQAPSVFRRDLFQGQNVLVTGGGTGLGFAMAKAFAEHGAGVAIASRKREHFEPAAKALAALGGRAMALELDVRDPARCEAVVAEVEQGLGPLDVLVNNAAGNFLVGAEEMSANAWNAVRGIVLDGTFYMSKAAGRRMLARGRGAMVNVVTNYAWGAAPLVAHSGAAKAGVLNLTRTLAVEWGARGVRVNAIAPGPVPTPGAFGQLVQSEDVEKMVKASVPLGRFGTPEEIAWAALYLCSPAAAYVTGECLVVDGGQWLNAPLFGHAQG